MRGPKVRVEDMLQASENIERHVQGTEAAFAKDEVLQVYAVYHLVIVGEAALKLPNRSARGIPMCLGRAWPVCGTYSFTTISEWTRTWSGK